MEFTDVLDSRQIVTHLDVNSKDEVFNRLADCFVETGIIDNKEQFIKDVYEREKIGVTGIGNYIAIPHGRSESVKKPGVAIALSDHEIEWESLDDTGAKVVILFAVGADDEGANEHLKLLAMFSKRLGNDAIIQRLFKANTVDDVMASFLEDEEENQEESEEADLDLDEISIL